MIVYTTIASEDCNVELTAIVKSGEVSPIYESLLLSFKDDCGKELECWDNEIWIRRFIDHLREWRWSLLTDMIEAYPDRKLDVDYFKENRRYILELWDAAKELKIV